MLNHRTLGPIASLFILILFCRSVSANVSRTILKERIEKSANTALFEQLEEDTTLIDKETVKEKISARVSAFAATVGKLPSDSIDDDVADWVEESIVSHLSGLGLRFLSPHFGDSAYKAYIDVANKFFPNLSNQYAKVLLKRRESSWTKVVKYDNDLKAHLISKFSSAERFSLTVMHPSTIMTLKSVINANSFDQKNHPLYRNSKIIQPNNTQIDLSSSIIDSSTETISLIRLMRQTFEQDISIQWFVYRNIISPTYTDKDKGELFDNIRDFNESKQLIDDAISSVVNVKDGLWSFSDLSINNLIDYSLSPALYARKPVKSLKYADTEGEQSVLFTNSSEEWDKFVVDIH